MGRFNQIFRVEVLDVILFNSISELQRAADEWLMDYNEYRPHESLGDVPPAAFLPRVFERNVSSFKLSTWQGSLRRQLKRSGAYQGTGNGSVGNAARHRSLCKSTKS